jgi:putative ABC transport system permease protein
VQLSINDNASLRGEVLKIFDQTFRITWGLELIALAVAILGVANTLLAVALERRRELAILRFLGSTSAQTRRMLLAESGLIGILSVLVGSGMGAILAVILIEVINVQSFGWTIQIHIPWLFLLLACLLVFLATLAAGWGPARVARKLDPLRAVAVG